MATPIAHSLVGMTLYLLFTHSPFTFKKGKGLLFCAFLASLPDFDFIPGLFVGDYNFFHRGISHSIGGSVMISFVCFLFLKKRSQMTPLKLFLLLFFSYSSHLVIDFFTRDTWPPCGAMFLWPFSHAYFKSPVDFFMSANRAPWTLIFSLQNLLVYAIEIVVFGTVLFFCSKRGLKKED